MCRGKVSVLMTSPQHVGRKRYGLFVLAILLILLAGVAGYFGSKSYPIRVLGLASVIASVYLVRISRVHQGSTSLPNVNSVEYGGPSRLLWILSSALVPLLGASVYLLH